MASANPFQTPDYRTADVRVLPNSATVMFPYAVLPIQLRGSADCQLLRDALATDSLVATIWQPGLELDIVAAVDAHDIACVCRIVAQSQVSPDRWNVLLSGICRARIRHRINDNALYPQAEVTILHDVYNDAQADERIGLKHHILGCLRRHTPNLPAAAQQFDLLWTQPIPLGQLVDVVAFTIALPLEFKQQLLQELDVNRRARALANELERIDLGRLGTSGDYPPGFSQN